MRFYRLNNNQKIYGFGDACADAPLLGLPLKTRQKMVVAEVDGVVIDIESETEIEDGSCFIFNANTYFSPAVARFICNYVRQSPGSYEFVLADNRFNQRFVLPDAGFPSEYGRFGLYYRHRQQPPKKRIVIEQKVYANHTALPRQLVIEGKKRSTVKVYLAIFVCFSTKAVHIEVVSSLTSSACILALKRFTGRRGVPEKIYSDNGSNFTVARKELLLLQGIIYDKHA